MGPGLYEQLCYKSSSAPNRQLTQGHNVTDEYEMIFESTMNATIE